MFPEAVPTAEASLAGPDGLLMLTQAAVRRGDHQEGVQLAEAALRALREDDVAKRALALRLLAVNRWRIGDCEAAARAAEDAISLYQVLGDKHGEAETLNAQCMIYIELALHREALDFAIRSLTLAREVKDLRLECWALNRVGVSYEYLADPRLALTYMQQALRLARDLPRGDEEMFAALNNLASCEVKVADESMKRDDLAAAETALADAKRHAEEALDLARRSGNTHRETVALGNLAMAYSYSADRETAQALVEQYQALARRHGYRSQELSADFDLANLLRRDGRHALAALRLEQLLLDAAEAEDPQMRMHIEHALYESYKTLGRFEQALGHMEQYAGLERQHLKTQAEAQARVLLARLEIDQARAETERARLDAELQRLRAKELEEAHRTLSAKAEALGRAAREDSLTGLSNRRMIDEALPALLERARDERSPFAIAMADLDHFKQINDRFGHIVGDRVLTRLATLLRANTRGADLLARVGGEEFIVVLAGATIDLAHEICERLRLAVAQHPWYELAPGLAVTVSIGLVAGRPEDERELLIERADAALYEAKRRGRDQVYRAQAT